MQDHPCSKTCHLEDVWYCRPLRDKGLEERESHCCKSLIASCPNIWESCIEYTVCSICMYVATTWQISSYPLPQIQLTFGKKWFRWNISFFGRCFLYLAFVSYLRRAFHWNVLRLRCSRASVIRETTSSIFPPYFFFFFRFNKVWKSPQLTGVREADHLVNSKLGSDVTFLPFQTLSKKGAQWGLRHPLMDVVYRLSQDEQI